MPGSQKRIDKPRLIYWTTKKWRGITRSVPNTNGWFRFKLISYWQFKVLQFWFLKKKGSECGVNIFFFHYSPTVTLNKINSDRNLLPGAFLCLTLLMYYLTLSSNCPVLVSERRIWIRSKRFYFSPTVILNRIDSDRNLNSNWFNRLFSLEVHYLHHRSSR